jgi:hypothetical protein
VAPTPYHGEPVLNPSARALRRGAERQIWRAFGCDAEDERALLSRLCVRTARCSGTSFCVLDPAIGDSATGGNLWAGLLLTGRR